MCRAADLVWNSVTSDRPFFGVLLSKKRMTFNQQLVNVIYMMLSMQTVIQHNVSRELCFMYKWKTDTTLNAHRCIGCFILFLFLLLNMRNREYICKCYSNSPTLFRFHLIVSNVMLCAFFPYLWAYWHSMTFMMKSLFFLAFIIDNFMIRVTNWDVNFTLFTYRTCLEWFLSKKSVFFNFIQLQKCILFSKMICLYLICLLAPSTKTLSWFSGMHK